MSERFIEGSIVANEGVSTTYDRLVKTSFRRSLYSATSKSGEICSRLYRNAPIAFISNISVLLQSNTAFLVPIAGVIIHPLLHSATRGS